MLITLEKQTRTGADMHSTAKVLVCIVQICYEVSDFTIFSKQVYADSHNFRFRSFHITFILKICQIVVGQELDRPQRTYYHVDQKKESIETSRYQNGPRMLQMDIRGYFALKRCRT